MGKREPFDLPAAEAYLAVERTADLLLRPHRDLFKAHGITQPLYNVLRVLLGHEGDPRGGGGAGVPAETVAQQMVKRDPDVSRLSARLVDKGLVRRLPDPTDGRVVRLALTPEGRRLARTLIDPSRDLFRRQFACLDGGETRQLVRLLAKVRATQDPQS